jgi:trk system potassium uptake protein TrkA
MDSFIALTPNSETNIIASLMAEESGVYKTIALVDNTIYTHISQNIGVDTLINKKIIAANNIFRYVRKGKIEAIASLHGVDAEIIEYIIHRNNTLTKKPLRDLHFPENAIIAGVIRGEESLLPNGDFQLQVDDKVIVFAMSKCISRLEELFR